MLNEWNILDTIVMYGVAGVFVYICVRFYIIGRRHDG